MSQPIAFTCPVHRRNKSRTGEAHRHVGVRRTGRTKPSKARKASRMSLVVSVEFVCPCGHIGWTTHPDILRYPDTDDVRLTEKERDDMRWDWRS